MLGAGQNPRMWQWTSLLIESTQYTPFCREKPASKDAILSGNGVNVVYSFPPVLKHPFPTAVFTHQGSSYACMGKLNGAVIPTLILLYPTCKILNRMRNWFKVMNNVTETTVLMSFLVLGTHPSERKIVWKYLFGVYPEKSTTEERRELDQQMSSQYHWMKYSWKQAFPWATTMRVSSDSKCLLPF